MNSIDETMIMSLFAHTQQKVIAQDIFEKYNISNPQAVKAALDDAANLAVSLDEDIEVV